MKKLKVVAHEYGKNSDTWNRSFYENFFPIGSICELKDDKVISPIDSEWFQQVDGNLVAHAGFSAIVFAPVSEPDQ